MVAISSTYSDIRVSAIFLNNGKPINSNAVIDAYKEIDIEQTAKIRKKRQRQSMKISECETILNEVKFVKSHEEIIEKNRNRPKLIQPYIDRLNKYYKLKNNG